MSYCHLSATEREVIAFRHITGDGSKGSKGSKGSDSIDPDHKLRNNANTHG
jgi:hypothetical protein